MNILRREITGIKERRDDYIAAVWRAQDIDIINLIMLRYIVEFLYMNILISVASVNTTDTIHTVLAQIQSP
jgi:hypothetical protein